MVEYPNDPSVSCTVCQPPSRKNSIESLIWLMSRSKKILPVCGLELMLVCFPINVLYVFLYSLRVDPFSIHMFYAFLVFLYCLQCSMTPPYVGKRTKRGRRYLSKTSRKQFKFSWAWLYAAQVVLKF